MATVQEHYENVLSEVYSWMYGGFSDASQKYREFFASRDIRPTSSGLALDLGAGSGFQSIPLAEVGFRVTAIDLSEELLNECRKNATNHDIRVVRDDLMNFSRHCPENVELVVCMTDTILHLETRSSVELLFKRVFQSLEPNGRFALSFRDLTFELKDTDRFLPVRSDENTIFTCFLEYESDTVKVHDFVYRKSGSNWTLTKSFFRKLRLSPQWVLDRLTQTGFEIEENSTDAGMTCIISRKLE
ncbi:MAG: class I SAM-dependent methyltransferase [Myxococcota bacterium]|nr:class I SAM-dependent methyltransferase [Myxococcota bacterium]